MSHENNFLKEGISIFIALLFISLCAQIAFSLPGGIPFTGQSFAVLSVAICLGWLRGGIAVLLYLIIGALGAPIFAGGAGGYLHFLDGSSGYLIGFLVSAIVVGLLKTKGFDRTFKKSTISFLVGHIVILVFGAIGIFIIYDIDTAINYGIKPFILAAILKSLLGGLVMPIYYEIKEEW